MGKNANKQKTKYIVNVAVRANGKVYEDMCIALNDDFFVWQERSSEARHKFLVGMAGFMNTELAEILKANVSEGKYMDEGWDVVLITALNGGMVACSALQAVSFSLKELKQAGIAQAEDIAKQQEAYGLLKQAGMQVFDSLCGTNNYDEWKDATVVGDINAATAFVKNSIDADKSV